MQWRIGFPGPFSQNNDKAKLQVLRFKLLIKYWMIVVPLQKYPNSCWTILRLNICLQFCLDLAFDRNCHPKSQGNCSIGLSVLLKSPLIYRNITPGHTKPIWRYDPIFFCRRKLSSDRLISRIGQSKGHIQQLPKNRCEMETMQKSVLLRVWEWTWLLEYSPCIVYYVHI